jgi:aldehyde dehydrogenase (NAD+)
MKEYKLYINGEWVETKTGQIVDDLNPADGSLFARVHTAGEKEIEAALAGAAGAFMGWSSLPASRRERVLLQAADNLEAIQEEAIEILIEEAGSTFMKAKGEVSQSANTLRIAAGECRRVEGEVLQPTSTGQLSLSIRVPLGVVAAIAPFNFPINITMKKIAYAMAIGNTIVLKPASYTPATGYLVAKIFEMAGLPAGVLNVIPGPGKVVGDRLVEDPRVKCITFTGSSSVGRSIAAKAAKNLKKYAMELGGKNPLIVLKDFDASKAAEIAGYGAFYNQGQTCIATARIIVEDPLYDAVCEQMIKRAKGIKVGDPHEKDTVVGPLIHPSQCDFIDGQIKDAVSKGAKVLYGGTHEGSFFQPTVLADVTQEMDIFYQESFGPIVSIFRAKDSMHALELANDNEYGLSSSILTNDLNLALQLALKMQAGMVHVNDSTVVSTSGTAPSGGVKMSGFGKESGKFSVDMYSDLKWVTLQYIDKKMIV